MRIKFIKDYTAKTGTGSRTIKAGTVLDLAPDKAQALINAGVAKAVDTKAFTLLDEGQELIIAWLTESGRKIYLIDSPEVHAPYLHKKQGEACFTYEELKAMEGISREEVEQVIDVKEVFPGADVIEHVRKGVKREWKR